MIIVVAYSVEYYVHIGKYSNKICNNTLILIMKNCANSNDEDDAIQDTVIRMRAYTTAHFVRTY